jgi:hypothetical protein
MAGLVRLVPAIHVLLAKLDHKDVDARHKAGHARDTSAFTRVFNALCAGMTSRES